LIIARAERKVRLCVKLFVFFRGWIVIRFTWNLSRFVPNSVEILTWNFRKKLFQENFSEIFAQTKAILYTSFVHSRSGTYQALLLGCFGLKFLPDVRHCVYWVLEEIWAPDSSHKIGNKFFIYHFQSWKEGSFVCETVWFFS